MFRRKRKPAKPTDLDHGRRIQVLAGELNVAMLEATRAGLIVHGGMSRVSGLIGTGDSTPVIVAAVTGRRDTNV